MHMNNYLLNKHLLHFVFFVSGFNSRWKKLQANHHALISVVFSIHSNSGIASDISIWL